MKGQISIEYTGGAILFFSSILFVITGVLGTLPEFTNTVTQNSIETEVWSSTTHLMSNPGRWQTGGGSGPDWHRHLDDTTQVGLADQQGDLSRGKIEGLLEMDYQDLKILLQTQKDFILGFTEYHIIDTAQTFEKNNPTGDIDDVITEPTGTTYGEADSQVRYGSTSFKNAEKHFLVTAHDGEYDTIYVSDDWDFTDATIFGPTDNRLLDFDGEFFRLKTSSSGIFSSDGKTVVLSRSLGSIGTRTPAAEARIVTARRYGTLGSNPVRIDIEMWE